MSEENNRPSDQLQEVLPVSGMYENWFLDYASYVIMERAVPAIEDGMKPVQRRILHALKEMDDGRFNKVANVIGSTMQYHPHGDASIADAIVNIGQKDLLLDTQGNWGDVRTGDSSAAPRYIETRLSKFALDVIYNNQTTDWQLSYDGRKKEPITFPVKFPLLLAQGVEGIAVGLSTKILPHNFIELIEGAINILKGKKVKLYPDFLTGGKIDVSDYNDGKRGGKVRVRAVIEEVDNKTLVVKDIPYGTTTTSLIDSIIKANDKGKIKIKKVIDNTAKDIEVQIQLPPNTSPDITIDALYAFTDCEVSISPNACVIYDDKPQFLRVDEILKHSVEQTKDLLKKELEIRKGELMEKMLFSSLEKIFIENRIYRDIEECETWEAVIQTIDQGLEPYKPQFYRVITEEDIVKLTEIKIKRISRFDAFKADELMKRLSDELAEVEHNLANLTEFAIEYYTKLLTKYGKGKERKTEITNFDTISATIVAANNAKLYVNRADGFVGYGLKKDEFVCECSDIDDIIVFRKDGICQVVRIQDKVFVGKNILYAGVFNKADERMVYNMIYTDGKSGRTMVKRFQVMSITRDREYELTKGGKGKVQHFSANPNGEAEIVTVYLTAASTARKKVFDFDFADVEIKGRGAGGNILTKYPVRKVQFKSAGVSTLGGLDIWYDETVGRLNTDDRGEYLGNFKAEDHIIVFYKDGSYELTSFELTNRYETNQILGISICKKDTPINALHYDASNKYYYVKRFLLETNKQDKRYGFISEEKGSKLIFANNSENANLKVTYKEGRKHETKELNLAEVIDVKGWKAMGNRSPIQNIISAELIPEEKPEKEESKEENQEESTPEDTTSKAPESIEQDEKAPAKKVDFDIKSLKDSIKTEVEKEDNQLGLFSSGSED
ncbi:MAG: DNA gyrase/topoisomerase IV subunit A [Cyclobacteriaceae bacterium]